jgi:hypothetical protein
MDMVQSRNQEFIGGRIKNAIDIIIMPAGSGRYKSLEH